jgi:alkyldihydroxyacetonephosphate synthase
VDPLDPLRAILPEGAVSTHPGEVAARTRDWWALAMLREARGEILDRPVAVVFPQTTEEVSSVLVWAQETGTPVVPRGGGSGVSGGAQAHRRSVVLDLSEMRDVLAIDTESQAVEVQAGIRGDRLEAALEERGLTLGHYPQSLALSSVGGWIASGSAGQASAGHGVIEDLVLGLAAVLADGRIVRLRAVPRSAAGPDLRRLFVGSEGTLGVITEATLSASRPPGAVRWVAAAPAGFVEGIAVVREAMQQELRPLVVRLYDGADAALTFGEIGHAGGPVLVAGFAEPRDADASEARRLAASMGAGQRSEEYGMHWWGHRFDAVDVYRRIMGRDRSLGSGVVVDTMEVAALWGRLPELHAAVGAALRSQAEAVGCHLSHPYRSGASLFFTFLVRGADDRAAGDAYLRCWQRAARACHGAGGTVTHHHGVGLLKAPFMEDELGRPGLEALRAVKSALDPAGILNPGKLVRGGG